MGIWSFFILCIHLFLDLSSKYERKPKAFVFLNLLTSLNMMSFNSYW
jgi:hypothetical protein